MTPHNLLERIWETSDAAECIWLPCMDCGGPANFWADEDAWDAVMGSADAGVVCLRCYALRAEVRGVTDWHLRIEDWPRRCR